MILQWKSQHCYIWIQYLRRWTRADSERVGKKGSPATDFSGWMERMMARRWISARDGEGNGSSWSEIPSMAVARAQRYALEEGGQGGGGAMSARNWRRRWRICHWLVCNMRWCTGCQVDPIVDFIYERTVFAKLNWIRETYICVQPVHSGDSATPFQLHLWSVPCICPQNSVTPLVETETKPPFVKHEATGCRSVKLDYDTGAS